MAELCIGTVVGIERTDYYNKNGDHITGRHIFVEFEDSNVEGLAVEDVYASSRSNIPEVRVGDVLDFRRNRYGNISSAVLINSEKKGG